MLEVRDVTKLESLLTDGGPPAVRVCLFDMDDTLYPEKQYVRSGYRQIARLFPQIGDMEEKLWQAFEAGEPAIDAVLARAGFPDEESRQKALHAYRFQEPEDLQLYPGVRQMLERLRASGRFGIGMITDGRPFAQRAKIKALGIEKYFDKVIITDELGGLAFRKPNPTAFKMMQEYFGVPYGEMVYVGDNINKDFKAPQSLGMKSIRFRNPDGLYQ